MIPAVLIRVQQLNDSTYTFWLKTEQPLDYTAGQFIEMHIPHQSDERGTHRWLTLSSSPSEELLAVTTRKTAKMSSFKQQLFGAKTGDTVHISQAMGDFVLPMQLSIPIIFVTRGIGITPVRSMTKQLIDEKSDQRDIAIIHSVRDSNDLLFKDVYRKIASPCMEILESSSENIQDLIVQTLELYNQKPSARIYISGPEQFAEKVFASLTTAGVKPSALVADYFHGYN